ncbi:MAG: DUF2244 domain-containing protein [Pseudomonadota bacterium]
MSDVLRPETGAAADAAAFPTRQTPPIYTVKLWPHRSLSVRGFQGLILCLAVGFLIPLVPFLGTPVAWGLLPFLIGALVAVYAALMRSYDDGKLTETLCLWPDLITVVRAEPRGAVKRWHANPHWVRTQLRNDTAIESYLTLTGNGREIELGSFLSPGERRAVYGQLSAALATLNR